VPIGIIDGVPCCRCIDHALHVDDVVNLSGTPPTTMRNSGLFAISSIEEVEGTARETGLALRLRAYICAACGYVELRGGRPGAP
jgi:hypothetical protein